MGLAHFLLFDFALCDFRKTETLIPVDLCKLEAEVEGQYCGLLAFESTSLSQEAGEGGYSW